MIDIGGDNRAAPRHFIAYEFRCHDLWERRSETVSGVSPGPTIGAVLQGLFPANIFAQRDVLHLRCNDARVVHLRTL